MVLYSIIETDYLLDINIINNEYVFKIVRDNSIGGSRAIRCEGSGISFAKCVKNAVDKYGCQKVTKISDDKYISEDC